MAQTQPIALYRKYRGLSFDDIIGQKHITDILQQAIVHGRVSHAYLFTGPRGVGKTSVARILAHKINDLDYRHEDNHIDIIEIDAASNRRIDEIRDLREKSHIAPVNAKYKVYIIDEVHMLTKEAFNALLKTLEEPPEHVVFILATTEAHKLPSTIVSRTQRHAFRPIGHHDMVEHLTKIAKQEAIPIDTAALQVIAEHADGSFRDAISLLDQVSGIHDDKISEADVRSLLGLADEQSLQTLVELIASGAEDEIMTHIQALIEQGRQPELLALQLAAYIRKSQNFYDNLELVEALIDIPTRVEPRMHLEITLLKHCQPHTGDNRSRPKVSSARSKKDVKPVVPAPPQPAEQKQDESKPAQKASKKSSQTKYVNVEAPQWQAIIAAVKDKNNAVASILRNSKTTFENGSVQLTVKFEFHKKKLESGQATEFVQAAAQQVCNGPIELVISVEQGSGPEARSEPSSPQSEDYSSTIIDAFGGGERVKI